LRSKENIVGKKVEMPLPVRKYVSLTRVPTAKESLHKDTILVLCSD
jgi:hypothetical protein